MATVAKRILTVETDEYRHEHADVVPLLPFAEMLDLQASWYRSKGTTFAAGCARLFAEAAADARATGAQTWADLEARSDALMRDREHEIYQRGQSMGYDAAMRDLECSGGRWPY